MKRGAGFLHAHGFEEVAQKLYDAAFRAVAQAFEEDIAPVVDAAANAWPVQSGESSGSLFGGGSSTTSDELALELGNSADYSGVIHSGQTAEDLLFRPIRVAARRAAITIGRVSVGSR